MHTNLQSESQYQFKTNRWLSILFSYLGNISALSAAADDRISHEELSHSRIHGETNGNRILSWTLSWDDLCTASYDPEADFSFNVRQTDGQAFRVLRHLGVVSRG